MLAIQSFNGCVNYFKLSSLSVEDAELRMVDILKLILSIVYRCSVKKRVGLLNKFINY